ncbi:retrovirus-related pol polyprotein from transposon TNT 1-94 [Tanacetum coccineum]
MIDHSSSHTLVSGYIGMSLPKMINKIMSKAGAVRAMASLLTKAAQVGYISSASGLSEKVLFCSGLSDHTVQRFVLFYSGLSDRKVTAVLSFSDSSLDRQRQRLENGKNILQSIDEGLFKMGKFRETLADGALGPERDRVVKDLTPDEKERFKADIRATNILLQGLPKDIYTLINHYTNAKYIWDNVKILLKGSELTKDEHESHLYDDFEHFRQNKVKLNRGLKTSNYDQLYAYLKQHVAHTNENKMMLERYTQHSIDPLTFVSNISPQQVVVQNVHGRQNRDQGNNARGAVAAGNRGFQNRVGNANPGQAKPIKCYNCNGIGHISRQCTHPKRQQNSEYFKDKMLLMQAQENGVVLDEE